ncbi:MAG: magnesium transporter [Actinomycetota bacterium]
MRRGLGHVLAYWRAERRTIAQGFVALLIATAGSLLAGVVLGKITGTLERLPGLMVLMPAAIATRGNIFGAMASRLGTTIHSGLFEVSRDRGGVLYQNLFAATVLTLAISLGGAALARILSVAFGLTTISLADFVVISIVGGVLASIFVGAIAIGLSVAAYRREWDLDSVASPLITASGDMFTVPALFLASFIVGLGGVTVVLSWTLAALALGLTVWGLLYRRAAARRVIRESLPILLLAAAADVLAGLVLQSRLDEFAAFPALLLLIPPILGNAGGLGGTLSSRLASKLHLGALTPRGLPEAVAFLDFSIILLTAVLTFPLLGLAAHGLAALLGLSSPGAATMIGVTVMAGLLVTLLTAFVAYYTAAATYRVGLDPDNHGLPTITSSMDLLGVVCVVLALQAFGVTS